jgi:hypothetical protein
MTLPRTTEALVHDRVKFRVGRIVCIALFRDERIMGFAFPKEERDGAVGAERVSDVRDVRPPLSMDRGSLDAVDEAR